MKWLSILTYIVVLFCLVLCIWEFTIIVKKAIAQESFQAINELQFDELLPPTITLCPGEAWKSSGPFLNDDHFKRSTFTAEEIFHPKTLEALRNESLFIFKEQYASYYGLCFVLQKLTPEKISDYSFQIVINSSMDYSYYLHEPFENEWLFMSVYPYEVPVYHIDANNDDGIGAADIIYNKNIVRKIPGKAGCHDKTLKEVIDCWKDELARSLEKAAINCKVPALRFTRFDISHLNDCDTKDKALEVDGIIYKVAQDNLAKDICGKICSFTKYEHKTASLANNVLSKELKVYGDGYFIIWSFYSSLYVNEKVETYIFDFDSALVAVGGSLGLFLGWSIKSMVLSLAEYIDGIFCKYNSRNDVEEIKPGTPIPKCCPPKLARKCRNILSEGWDEKT